MATDTRSDRFDFRVSPANRRLIERAAAILGQPLTAFAVTALISAAEEVIEQDARRKLTDRDRRRFLSALASDRVVPALAKAAKRYRASFRRG